MRTATALLTTAVVLLAVGCGADPPTYCGDAIPQQEIFVGDEKTFEPCFENPGGGELTLSATSSDESVARAGLRRERVAIAGVSPGEASVKIEATNEDDLSADVSVSVRVPNRAPEYISDMTEATVILNRSLEWNLMEMFVEHDREEMTFDAASSNTGVVGVSVDGSVAQVTGLSDGVSQVTLKAEDPHGAEGTGTIEVVVKTPVLVFEDDFEDEETLDDWSYLDSMEASIEDGLLRLRYLPDGFLSWATQDVDEVTDFTVDVTMMPFEGGATGVFWGTGLESGIQAYLFYTGTLTEGRNWILNNFVSGSGWSVVAGGSANLIELDESEKYSISVSGNDFVITRGTQQVLSETIDDMVPTMVGVGLTGANLASEYDDIAVFGVPSSAPNADAPKIARPSLPRMIAFPKLDLPVKR